MKRHGDISLSFGVILSIIIIAAVIGVGFYTISYFLDLKSCTELGLFHRDLQEKIDDAWSSDTVRNSFTGIVPGSVEQVCIGDLEQGRSREEYSVLRRSREEGTNLYFYPPRASCEIKSAILIHAQFDGFSCIPVREGKVMLELSKDSFDSLVLVCDPRDTNCNAGVA